MIQYRKVEALHTTLGDSVNLFSHLFDVCLLPCLMIAPECAIWTLSRPSRIKCWHLAHFSHCLVRYRRLNL